MCFTDGGQDNNNEDAPDNNPSYTTVYVGNLPHDVSCVNWRMKYCGFYFYIVRTKL